MIPDIKGAKDFDGPSFHTADWRDDVDLSGKRVAVIGAGASGFQLVPAIADNTAARRRLPTHPAVDGTQPHVPRRRSPTGARWAIRHLPYYGRWLRFVSWWPIADALDEQVRIDPDWDDGGLSCSESNHAIREMFIAWMRVFCTDEELLAKVTPNYPPMGKRTLQDNGTWLTTLQRDDVELISDGIAEITADGVTTVDGVHRPADVLIWATGFDVNHQLGPINVRGLDGVELNDGVGRLRIRLPWRHRAGLPELLLHVRTGHQRRQRRQHHLQLRVPDALRHWVHRHGARGRLRLGHADGSRCATTTTAAARSR